MIDIPSLVSELSKIEHGFTHVVNAGEKILADPKIDSFEIAQQLLSEETYQGRMLGVHLLGRLAAKNQEALDILKNKVSKDPDWRNQEMLAKAFDQYCADLGYEKALSIIKEWLADQNPNVVRAVTEGLRIWTSKPFFKENPQVAIDLIAAHKEDESLYLRKSVGNSLRDIGKKFPHLIDQETSTWDLSDLKIMMVQKLVYKNRQPS